MPDGEWERETGGEVPHASRQTREGARLRAALRSLGLYAVTLMVVVTVIFALPRAMPGDPITQRTDPSSTSYLADPTLRAKLLAFYDLSDPLPLQYVRYLGRIAHGDLGFSISLSQPVSEVIRQHLPWTLLLVGTALALSSTISFIVGVGAAWRRGQARDRLMVVAMTGARSVPEYATASIMLILFAVVVRAFPLAGSETPFVRDATFLGHVVDVAYHLILPATALALGQLGAKFLLVRNTTIGVLGEDYMLLARSKGLSTRRLKFHHAGRNAALPFLTVLGMQVAFAVGGAFFIETVFGYPGMGSLVLSAVDQLDYPLLEGCFLTLAAALLAVNFLIELVYARLDPRVAG